MHQIIQYQKSGEIIVAELPEPVLKPGYILVRNMFSLISAGTERTSVETAQASMIAKAQSRPDLVKQVMDNVKREGFTATYQKVKERLDNYKELGYSSAGIVVKSAVEAFKPGDRVACAGVAYHAEMVLIPKNLAVRLPDDVSFEEAACTTLAAIAMQGVRQADVRLGESVAVIGLGLLGLITVQLLKAGGCAVIGLDLSKQNFELCRDLGCDACAICDASSTAAVESFTKGRGTDAVIITAGTKSNDPMELALQYARKKSRIVVVGAVGMNVPRKDFYEKEIDIRISCSYGPGRYDQDYEDRGHDYPIGYVRWTENRNMEAAVALMASKQLRMKPLISHTISLPDAVRAYDLITGKVKEPYIGILLEYPSESALSEMRIRTLTSKGRISARPDKDGRIGIGFIGAGNFAQSYLLPPLQKLNVDFVGVATDSPVNAKSVSEKFGFEFFGSDPAAVYEHENVDAVFIATRHDSHSRYVLEALKKGKSIFVEKPLAINEEELVAIEELLIAMPESSHPLLMVGFNRRFSKPFQKIKDFFSNRFEPMSMLYRVNAGFIPKTHWVQDPSQGGRIIGEMCHFFDTMQYLTGAEPASVYATAIRSDNAKTTNEDSVNCLVTFSDGSTGNVLYLANGDSSLPKEYCEVACGGKTAVMRNFSLVECYADGKKTSFKYDGRKGHKEEVEHFISAIRGKEALAIAPQSLMDTTRLTFKVLESLQNGGKVDL